MSQTQKIFEAIMRVKGHTDFTIVKNKYTNPGMQTRWIYFQLGWEMHEVTK